MKVKTCKIQMSTLSNEVANMMKSQDVTTQNTSDEQI